MPDDEFLGIYCPIAKSMPCHRNRCSLENEWEPHSIARQAVDFKLTHYPDAAVPPLLRSVEWKPASGTDPQLTAAIKRYRRRGMEGCVSPGRGYYDLLLNAFADRMKEMPPLNPAAFEPDLENGDDAFTAAWLKPQGTGQVQSPTPVAEPMGPGALVMTYITNQPLLLDPRPVKFVDNLVNEASGIDFSPVALLPDAVRIQNLLVAVRLAAALERLQVFHCTSKLDTLDAADRLTRQLEALTGRNVLTALVVDPAVWVGGSASEVAPAVEAVVLSDRWAGPLIIPLPGQEPASKGIITGFEQWHAEKCSLRQFAMLPPTLDAMVEPLRMLLMAERGRVMKTGTPTVPPSSDRPPNLGGVDSTTR